MKDSASSGIEKFLQFESDSFHVLAGSANFLFPAMMGGSVGGTVSLANSLPRAVGGAVPLRPGARRSPRRPLAGARHAHQQGHLRPVRRLGRQGGDEPGRIPQGGIPRRPLLPLTDEQLEGMRQVLAQEGLLP